MVKDENNGCVVNVVLIPRVDRVDHKTTKVVCGTLAIRVPLFWVKGVQEDIIVLAKTKHLKI